MDAHCVACVIRLAENIPLQPVSCLKSPVCSAWHTPVSPQLSPTGRAGEVALCGISLKCVEMGRAPISLTFPSSSAAKTFLGSKGGHTPSHRLHRPFPSYTGLWISSSLTHTQTGGPQWQLIVIVMDGSCYSLFSCLTLYIVVSLPHSFTLSGGFISARQKGSPTWVPPPLSCSFLLYSCSHNSFCLPASYTLPLCPSLYIPSLELIWGKN